MKTKRIISLLASLAMIVTAVTGTMTVSVVSAAEGIPTSGKCGESATWLINSDGVLVISGTGEIDTNNFGQGWSKLNYGINEVVVEEGITVASNAAVSTFIGFPNLSKIIFPSSLTKFNSCFYIIPSQNLKDIYVYSKNIKDASDIYISPSMATPWAGSGVIWHVYKESATEKSLRNDLKLTDEDIEYIPDDEQMPTVSNKTPLKLEPVGETSGPAGFSTKYEWDETKKTLTFSGKGLITIADYYKQYAEETEHIVIEKGITVIDANTQLSDNADFTGSFCGFTALKDVQLSDTIQEIGDCAFYKTPLEEITFPDSLNIIGEAAFYGTKIKSINLHKGMAIGGKAFYECNSLKDVKIPNNVLFRNSNINGAGMQRPPSTFSNCIGLETATIENGCAIYDAFMNKIYENGIVECLFSNCTSLKTIIMRGDFDFIHNKAFYNCTSLTDIYMYNTGLTTITAKGTNLAGAGAGFTNYADSFDTSNNPTFHVVKGSTTEQTLKDAGYLTADNTVYLADTTALETAISEAEAIETDKYTDESVSAFTEALENAKALLDNMNATQDEVDNAVKAINDAKNALEEKKAEPSESDPTDPSDSSDPTTPTKPTSPTGGNVKKTTSPAQKASEAKADAEKAIKQAKIVSLTAKAKGKKKITVSWKKVAKAAGYEVQASTKKNFKKNVIKKATTKNKVVFKKLKSKKKYFVRVRAYKTYKDAKGKTQKVYSKWVKSKKKVKVK